MAPGARDHWHRPGIGRCIAASQHPTGETRRRPAWLIRYRQSGRSSHRHRQSFLCLPQHHEPGSRDRLGAYLRLFRSHNNGDNSDRCEPSINTGSSGGPLIDLKNGEVIGINTAIATQNFAGIALALPIDGIKRILPDLLAGKTPKHAWLPIHGTSITPLLAAQCSLPVDYGVIVYRHSARLKTQQ